MKEDGLSKILSLRVGKIWLVLLFFIGLFLFGLAGESGSYFLAIISLGTMGISIIALLFL